MIYDPRIGAPVHAAITNRSPEISEVLVDVPGFDPNIRFGSVEEETALVRAVKAGYARLVERLLAKKELLINIRGRFGAQALHTAIQTYKIELAHMLLSDSRIDLGAKDHEGKTAKDHALAKGLNGLARLLANLEASGYGGEMVEEQERLERELLKKENDIRDMYEDEDEEFDY